MSDKEDKKGEESRGRDFYSALKKNNRIVWAVVIIAVIAIIANSYQTLSIYSQSMKRVYGIDSKGNLVPLNKLDDEEGRRIQARANIEYFVNNYYELDAYTMKKKKEKVMWLIGSQPLEIIKNRANSGYFDKFLSMPGLVQKASILQNTFQMTDTPPYQASFVVRIRRINGDNELYYNSNVRMTLQESSKNYPYNPYGFLITNFSEDLETVPKENLDETLKKDEAESDKVINQNPAENGKATNTSTGQ
ncbi:VirB8/TrbF family protein [Elizabethkingia anophelis]|uniref:VirB8/TrbF family protein n=1 Tax=Elizabethkingia anophelis TaxID=1117645 RepID=UPI0002AC3F9C|nr:VirB8/TrbF family protein [Elizabethkingia anophelis]ELR81114.1 conjugate transposon protein [Elizabethkingia anophelis R26]MCS7369690.1 hypothetical protein [Elizabethkingia anophelis]MCS7375007.1 hypothetical protein [Elizabethkingia anophelis]MCS7387336.1 hypothetical protein [Elizabethkingia anophelis]HAY3597926.1 hypothetical protein [Elizabethkingia anophelis]